MREVQWAPGHIGTCTKSLDSSALPSLAIAPLCSGHDGSCLAENCQRSVSTTTPLADGFLGWIFFLTENHDLSHFTLEILSCSERHRSTLRRWALLTSTPASQSRGRYTSTAFMLVPLDSPGPSRTVQCQGVPVIPFLKCSPAATSTNLSTILTSGEKAVRL